MQRVRPIHRSPRLLGPAAAVALVATVTLVVMSACPGGGGGGGPADAGPQHLTDGQVVKAMQTANEGEIALAQVALPKAFFAQVGAFADQMINDHTPANERLLAVASTAGITAAGSVVADQLLAQTQQTETELNGLTGGEFDLIYMQSQVTMHEHVLQLLNTQFIPSATNPALKAELQTEAGVVQAHLAAAKTVLSEVQAMIPDAGVLADGGVGDGGELDGGAIGDGGTILGP